MTLDHNLERAHVGGTELAVSRIDLGTWAIGGWMWGGTDQEESVATIHAAIGRGINLVDTAPACGFGRSEDRRPRHCREPSSFPSRYRYQNRARVEGW